MKARRPVFRRAPTLHGAYRGGCVIVGRILSTVVRHPG
ncbi:hypothetical protein GGR03_004035 [Aurantimonas endophytica]|uniref:Uncharacterized protein n=1 Tax=Aurantimonas endophytica TaxID=1522175 RepID=A0A7W6MRE0_9HYPH|nr:hypothetical protein [Aurantimonas endophytica]